MPDPAGGMNSGGRAMESVGAATADKAEVQEGKQAS